MVSICFDSCPCWSLCGPQTRQCSQCFCTHFTLIKNQLFRVNKENPRGQDYNARKVISEVYAVTVQDSNVNLRRMSQPDMGSIFHIKKSMKYSGHRKVLCELSKLSDLMLLTSSDTKRTLRHLLLFTNSAQRELVSICTQSIHDRN